MTWALAIELVILDWFGVVHSELTKLFNQQFNTTEEQQARIKEYNDKADAGFIGEDEVYTSYAAVMTEQTDINFSPSDARAWLNAHSGIDWEFVELVQQIRKKGVLVVIGSNAARGHRPNLVSIGMLSKFDEIFVSSLMGKGIKKPDRRFFEYILRDMDVSTQNTLFIDDSEEHVQAARLLGIPAEQYGVWGDKTNAQQILNRYHLI